MRALNDLILRFSRSAPLFVLAFMVASGSLFAVFYPLGEVFGQLTGGLQMFDFQNQLTQEQVLEQLPRYTPEAVNLYYAFMFVDYFFPFFAGIFLAAISAFSLRHLSPRAYDWVNARSLFPLLMIGTGFDWLENLSALIAVSNYPGDVATAASALVLAKKGKLFFVLISQAVGWSLLLLAILKWLGLRSGLLKPAT